MASDWTDDHYVTRRSETGGDVYRCWMTCRCGWSSGDLPDGNIPTTHRAELEHYRAVVEAERGWEYAVVLDGAVGLRDGVIVVFASAAEAAVEAESWSESVVVRRHPASEWEVCDEQ